MFAAFAGRTRVFAAISGAVVAAAGPPLDFYFLAWIGLVPLFYALEKSEGNGFAEGFIAGLVFNTGTIYWFAFNSGTTLLIATASMVVAVLMLASGWGLAAWLFKKIFKRLGRAAWISIPFAWSAWEGWLSNMGELAFPWSLLALSQAEFLPVLQIMEFTGVWGVSFWVVALNVAVFLVWRNSGLVRTIALLSVVALVSIPFFALQHAYRYYRGNPPTVRILIVQGNVDPLSKWVEGVRFSWAIYDSLTRAGGEAIVDLIVWPETAVPVQLTTQSYISEGITDLATDMDAAIVTGASAKCRKNDEICPLNAAFLVNPASGISDVYSKQILVPFGERVPFQRLFPVLGKLNFGQAEFLPGLRQSIFSVDVGDNSLRFPSLICYESAFPLQSRAAVNRGANLLVTISNDAWYGNCSEPYQIAAFSRFRCIETRRAMARASNAGISFLADPLGQVVAQTNLLQAEWKAGVLPLMEDMTFYVRHGDLFLFAVTMIYGVFLLISAFKPGAESNEDGTESNYS